MENRKTGEERSNNPILRFRSLLLDVELHTESIPVLPVDGERWFAAVR
jgi:hypothetical protein